MGAKTECRETTLPLQFNTEPYIAATTKMMFLRWITNLVESGADPNMQEIGESDNLVQARVDEHSPETRVYDSVDVCKSFSNLVANPRKFVDHWTPFSAVMILRR